MIHIMDIKIYYEDTDCGGVVYYANYLRYMERARTEYLADRGHSVKELMAAGTVFMVLRVEIDYKSPGRHGDVIEIETWVTDVTRATMVFHHIMREKTSRRLLVESIAKMVCVDAQGKPKRMPAECVDALR